MIKGPLSEQKSRNILIVYLAKFGNWLTKPSAAIRQPERRRQARLLSVLLIPMNLVIVMASFFDSTSKVPFYFLFLFILIISYGLSRTRYYLVAGTLVIIGGTFLTITNIFLVTEFSPSFVGGAFKWSMAGNYTPDFINLNLIWLSVSILLGSLILPLVIIFPVVIVYIVGLLFLPMIISELPYQSLGASLSFIILISVIALISSAIHDRDQRQLERERQKSDSLLLNILPRSIAEQLKESPRVIAQEFKEATILFADIVGFSPLAARNSASEVVDVLNRIFSLFDGLAEVYDLEKIKTIGDAYMVVGGLPTLKDDHVEAVANMALDMQIEMAELNHKDEQELDIRIGVHSGRVVAGVIGIKKFSYDVWGDTVNIASRMESQGIPGKIQVTSTIYERLKEDYVFDERGIVDVKGKGEELTYFLKGRKSEVSGNGKSISELKSKVDRIMDKIPHREVPEWDKRENKFFI